MIMKDTSKSANKAVRKKPTKRRPERSARRQRAMEGKRSTSGHPLRAETASAPASAPSLASHANAGEIPFDRAAANGEQTRDAATAKSDQTAKPATHEEPAQAGGYAPLAQSEKPAEKNGAVDSAGPEHSSQLQPELVPESQRGLRSDSPHPSDSPESSAPQPAPLNRSRSESPRADEPDSPFTLVDPWSDERADGAGVVPCGGEECGPGADYLNDVHERSGKTAESHKLSRVGRGLRALVEPLGAAIRRRRAHAHNDTDGNDVHVRAHPRMGIPIAIGVAVGLVIVIVLALSWNRWWRYDDAADVQGVWFANETTSSVRIDASTIALAPDAIYAYTLDPVAKTISYELGELSGSGRYYFDRDRTRLVVVDGKGFTAASTLAADAGRALHDFFAQVRGLPAADPAEEEGAVIFDRQIAEPAPELTEDAAS